MYTDPPKIVDAAMNCSLGDLLKIRVGFVSRSRGRDLCGRGYVANDGNGKNVSLRFGLVEARCGGVVV